jgi:hypothetical protein
MSFNRKDSNIMQLKDLIDKQDFDGAISYLEENANIPENLRQYNLGYLFYKKGNFVQAKLHLEKAKVAGMFSTDISKALKKVNQELQIEYIESELSWGESFFFTLKSLDFYHVTMVYLVLLVLLFWGTIKRWKVFLGIVLLSLFGGGALHFYLNQYSLIYLKKEQVVRQGPSLIFEELALIPAGMKILYDRESQDWLYVHYPRQFEGWLKKEKDGI